MVEALAAPLRLSGNRKWSRWGFTSSRSYGGETALGENHGSNPVQQKAGHGEGVSNELGSILLS